MGIVEEIEAMVSKTKLASMHVDIDTLSDVQKKYLDSWQEGT